MKVVGYTNNSVLYEHIVARRERDIKRMNGNRLEEHRKKVPSIHWALLAAVMTALLILGPIAVKAGEYKTFKESEGFLRAGAEVCFTHELSAEAIKLLNEYQSVVNLAEAALKGGPSVPEELAFFAQLMKTMEICGSVEGYARIDVICTSGGYVLARFTELDTGTFVAARTDLLPEGL